MPNQLQLCMGGRYSIMSVEHVINRAWWFLDNKRGMGWQLHNSGMTG
jgi:hypothetical protein